jgi:hypothetical protein
VTYADRGGDWVERMLNRTTHADALFQAGRRADAEALFRKTEALQVEHQPAYRLLYSLQGFRYCDLLLAAPDRAAWQYCLSLNPQSSTLSHPESCRAVFQRATAIQKRRTGQGQCMVSRK